METLPVRKIARGVPGEELGGVPRMIPRLRGRGTGQTPKWTVDNVRPMHATYLEGGIAVAALKHGLSDARLYQLFDKFDLPRGRRTKGPQAGTAKAHGAPREAPRPAAPARANSATVHGSKNAKQAAPAPLAASLPSSRVLEAKDGVAVLSLPCPACGASLEHLTILLRARR